MRTIIITLLIASLSSILLGQEHLNNIKKHGMEIQWYFDQDTIQFTMAAPTNGWVTIGFNETNSITGAYLLMGRVRQNIAEVVEHFTLSPGNYKPINSLDDHILVNNVSGVESNNTTTISFSVEVSSACKYQKELSVGKSYWMIIAYSLEDDFQHHSIMRTSVHITL
ncbi:DOMON domain-containing protein [Ulvibacter antarcticus]|uniref:DOMON domain-containing protein n=1 Tax=Ulvibacter antarcticus TaxID=442714 RepID=A0A3L9Y8Q4_9FLAO|nr:DOMON domain-containing protein [Ulvibacter antarcticus]RMA56744.1 DOMON domain-containing protein [Ulvibacter antarcticus]